MILLDTHALVWLMEGVPRLGRRAGRMIERAVAAEEIAVSAISFWEISLKFEKGRLRLSRPPAAWRQEVLSRGVAEVAVTGDIGIAATQLDALHPDPADRIIIATAQQRRALLLTGDGPIKDWPGPLLRQDAEK